MCDSFTVHSTLPFWNLLRIMDLDNFALLYDLTMASEGASWVYVELPITQVSTRRYLVICYGGENSHLEL